MATDNDMKLPKRLNSFLLKPVSSNEMVLNSNIKMLEVEKAKLLHELKMARSEAQMLTLELDNSMEEIQILKRNNSKLRRSAFNKQKLLESEKSKIEQLTDSLTSSVAFIDLEYTYRYINKTYETWFGIKKDDYIGVTVEGLAGTEFFNRVKPLYDRVFQGEHFKFEMEGTYNDKEKGVDNIRLVTRVSYVPAYDLDNNIIGAYLYGVDITENKEIEEAISASERQLADSNERLKEYIESNLQLEKFAHIAAHDMKAPLRTIASFSKLIQKKLGDKVDEKEKGYFELINQSTTSLYDLIGSILEFSKVGSQQLERSVVNIEDLVNKVSSFLKSSIEEKEAIILVDDMPTEMLGDKMKLYQVFQNLISNSLKFTSPERKPFIRIKHKATNDHWEFSVKDNGIGIQEQHLTKIFDSFERLHTQKDFEGTGLGLSICRKMIEQHGGTIYAKSNYGEGSEFIFTIAKSNPNM